MLTTFLSSISLASLAALSTASAEPARFEVSALVGTQQIQDDRFWRISEADVLTGLGLRFGWSPQRNVALLLDWHTGGSATELRPPSDVGLNIAHAFHRIGLGARGQLQLGEFVQPYLAAQGVVQFDRLRLDDDPDHDDNATQLRQNGAGLGVHVAAGVGFPVATGVSGLAVAPFIEAGYGQVFAHPVGEMGDLAFAGISGRVGIGLRF